MKKKLFLLLLALITVVWNVFSSEYQEERNISDVVLIQNTEGKCFVLSKTDDSEVSMYVDNHFDENDCGKKNFFTETGNIKASSPFFKKDIHGRDFICFTGTDSESEMEEDKLFIFMTGVDYTGYYSKVISFPKKDNIILKDFVISDSNELIVYIAINDNLLSKKINITSDSVSDRYVFSGYPIDDIKIRNNTEHNELFYGIFISKNDFYAFVLNDENERIEKIINNGKFYYLFDDFNPVCFFSDGQILTKIYFTDEITYKAMSIELDTDNIRDIFEYDNIINIIMRNEESIYSISANLNIPSYEKVKLCSNKNSPFIYIEKNRYFNDSIIMIIKDVGVYRYSENSWDFLINYKDIEQYINPELFGITQSKEKDFKISVEPNLNDGLFNYFASLNNLKNIPIYSIDNTKYDVIKNSSIINGLFYTFLKDETNIKIISREN